VFVLDIVATRVGRLQAEPNSSKVKARIVPDGRTGQCYSDHLMMAKDLVRAEEVSSFVTLCHLQETSFDCAKAQSSGPFYHRIAR